MTSSPTATVTPAINPAFCRLVGVSLVGFFFFLIGADFVFVSTIVPPSFCPISAAFFLIISTRSSLGTMTGVPSAADVATTAHSTTIFLSTSFGSDGMYTSSGFNWPPLMALLVKDFVLEEINNIMHYLGIILSTAREENREYTDKRNKR